MENPDKESERIILRWWVISVCVSASLIILLLLRPHFSEPWEMEWRAIFMEHHLYMNYYCY